MFDLQGAARIDARTEVSVTAQAGGCSPDQWEIARVACAVILQKQLSHVSREWLAEQIGRSVSRVATWLELARRKPAAPITLLLARRADGAGFVLDDQELERIFDAIRAHRALVGGCW